MRSTTRLLVPLSLLLAGSLLIPGDASAARTGCTTRYMLCINKAVQLPSPFEEMGSLECAAGYVGCVLRKAAVR